MTEHDVFAAQRRLDITCCDVEDAIIGMLDPSKFDRL